MSQTGYQAAGLNARSSVAATAQLINSSNDGAHCNGTCVGFTTSTTSMRITSCANAINDADQVVGVRQDTYRPGYPAVSYLWTRTANGLTSRELPPFWPVDINNAGQVVGASGNGTVASALLWQDGTVQNLGTLGGSSSIAVAINASGRVIGDSLTADGLRHAFWWEAGTMHDLGTLGGGTSSAIAIN